MTLLRVIGRFVLAAAALGSFGWLWSAGEGTTLGLLAVGLMLTSTRSPTVTGAAG